MDNTIVIGLVVALIVVGAIAVWLFMQKRQTERLQERFGPEYENTIRSEGDRARAEKALEARQERVEQLNIRPLSSGERDQFAERWRQTQARFVDDPTNATREADGLVGEVMQARGYPMGDFQQRAEDISVNHPDVVQHYRAAHDIALRNRDGDGNTEELRTAFTHYRALFDDLLEVE
ncbi:MAG TPA: hypothetical protein VHX16_14335, partial [Chloroflexota bacterium]|nr:hypothetical protein [Chloroflexota bacterium]